MLTSKRLMQIDKDVTFNVIPSFLYCEALDVRSEQHDWKIKPHRHVSLFQIFVVTSGGGRVQLDDEVHTIVAPAVVYIPNNVVHGFTWQVNSKGYVLSVTSAVIGQLVNQKDVSGLANRPFTTQVSDSRLADIERLCRDIQKEERSADRYSDMMLLAIVQRLLVWIFRNVPVRNTTQYLTKPEKKLAQFKSLIATHGYEHHLVGWFANQIGVSGAHLNQICKTHEKKSALSLIHEFLLDEAKRYLIFADLRISALADRLGFNDPAHFTKFFKNLTGETPKDYRRRFR